MDLLITGGSGLVGWDLVNRALARGHEVTYTYYSNQPTIDTTATKIHLDIREEKRVSDVISDQNPDVVVHAAAMTDVDECERSPVRARAVNVDGTRNIVDACEQTDTRLVFLSTSFVFSGKNKKFTENDRRKALNYYGETKIAAEDVVIEASIKNTVCRIDQPYCWPTSWQTPPFVSWVLARCEKEEPFPVFTDWYNTPVYVPDCNEAILSLLTSDITGIYHICGPDYINRFSWAQKIAEKFNYNPDLVKPTNSITADLPAKRPNNHLCNAAVKEAIGYSFRSIPEALDQMILNRKY